MLSRTTVETVVLLSQLRQKPDDYIEVDAYGADFSQDGFSDVKQIDIEDALCVVKALSQTHKLGIISDTWPSIDNQLKAIGVYDYFSTFTYSCDLGVFKPNEIMYLDSLQNCCNDIRIFVQRSVGFSPKMRC